MDNFSFVALDIETATGKRSSICEIGITIVKDSKIAESKSWLIQPKDNSYWRRNIEIHGINPEDTQDKPTLADIWEEIKGYIENKAVYGMTTNVINQSSHFVSFSTSHLSCKHNYFAIEIVARVEILRVNCIAIVFFTIANSDALLTAMCSFFVVSTLYF